MEFREDKKNVHLLHRTVFYEQPLPLLQLHFAFRIPDRCKDKLDLLANNSTFNVIRIDGMYDCERDKVRVCQDMESCLGAN